MVYIMKKRHRSASKIKIFTALVPKLFRRAGLVAITEPITKRGQGRSRRFPEVWVAAADELIEVAVESPCPGLE